MSKNMSFSNRLWTLPVTFDWRIKISKVFLQIEDRIIFQIILDLSFLKKVILLWEDGRQSLLSLKNTKLWMIKFKKKFIVEYPPGSLAIPPWS